MMTRATTIKSTALLLTLVYLFLSGFMAVEAEQHALKHEHGADHAAHHSSLICDWMCAASSVVHSADPELTQQFIPSFVRTAVYVERFPNNLSIFSFHIRPPPVSVS